LSIPNLITLGRIILVPAVVWAIISGEMLVAFALFLVAGISDAVDGFLAKRFHMASELGACSKKQTHVTRQPNTSALTNSWEVGKGVVSAAC